MYPMKRTAYESHGAAAARLAAAMLWRLLLLPSIHSLNNSTRRLQNLPNQIKLEIPVTHAATHVADLIIFI